jgi:hypothetical protein
VGSDDVERSADRNVLHRALQQKLRAAVEPEVTEIDLEGAAHVPAPS